MFLNKDERGSREDKVALRIQITCLEENSQKLTSYEQFKKLASAFQQ